MRVQAQIETMYYIRASTLLKIECAAEVRLAL